MLQRTVARTNDSHRSARAGSRLRLRFTIRTGDSVDNAISADPANSVVIDQVDDARGIHSGQAHSAVIRRRSWSAVAAEAAGGTPIQRRNNSLCEAWGGKEGDKNQ